MTDQGHVAQIALDDLSRHRRGKIGEGEGGKVARCGTPAWKVNGIARLGQKWTNLFPTGP